MNLWQILVLAEDSQMDTDRFGWTQIFVNVGEVVMTTSPTYIAGVHLLVEGEAGVIFAA